MKSDLTVFILTFNEALHIERCIRSVQDIATRIVVIDSYSTDATIEIAKNLDVDIFTNKFVNYAQQFNWSLDNIHVSTQWIMRLDADEYISTEARETIPEVLSIACADVDAFTLNLRRIFMGQWLRHGSLYPIRLARIWRSGRGRLEDRWMDEHLIVRGKIDIINADFADHNLNSLTWWTNKHNNYASREAVDLLNFEFHFMRYDSVANIRSDNQAGVKRWLKEHFYLHLPNGFRAFIYFSYRYFIRLGFLDGYAGMVFHCLQGFWYRFLVDSKVLEVKWAMIDKNLSIEDAIENILNINISQIKNYNNNQ